MTKQQFITAVEAKPKFIKWAVEPVSVETIGDIEKWNGKALVTTPDGVNIVEVWFIVDSVSGDANWQTIDTLSMEENQIQKKEIALSNYLKNNFAAFFILRVDLDNLWAEAEVFTKTGTDLVASKVLVFKKGNDPITHLTIV